MVLEDHISQSLKEKLQAILSLGLVEILHHRPFAFEKEQEQKQTVTLIINLLTDKI